MAVTDAEVLMWKLRARASIRALWLARHTCVGAKDRIHHWCRVIRIAEGHRYRVRVKPLTADAIGVAIEALLEQQQTKDKA